MAKAKKQRKLRKSRTIWHKAATVADNEWAQISNALTYPWATEGLKVFRENGNTPTFRKDARDLVGGPVNSILKDADLPFRLAVVGTHYPAHHAAKFAFVRVEDGVPQGVVAKPETPAVVPPSVVVERIRLRTDPELDIFEVTLEQGNGIWKHIAASLSDLTLFLEGLKAGVVMMGGRLEMPCIPSKPTKTMTEMLEETLREVVAEMRDGLTQQQ